MHLQLLELEADLAKLKAMPRRQDKVSYKRDELLPKWMPIVREYLQAVNTKEVTAYDHQIFAYSVVWLFDVSNYQEGIAMGLTAIKLGQPMAGKIKRNWPSFMADTIYDWAEKQAEAGNSIEPYFSQLFKKVRRDWRLPEQITAKYYKQAGLSLLRNLNGEVKPSECGDATVLEQADELLAKAALIHDKVQVKTMRNKIAMRLRALTDYQAQH